jgi:hypothetical protein
VFPVLDHFQGYAVDKKKSTRFDFKPVVNLEDQFGSKNNVEVDNLPAFLFVPVSKDGEPVLNPGAHLACYKIKGAKANMNVNIANQFGEQALKLKEGKLLCVPSTKEIIP